MHVKKTHLYFEHQDTAVKHKYDNNAGGVSVVADCQWVTHSILLRSKSGQFPSPLTVQLCDVEVGA
ncbi:hypothetical protein DPMN_067756 [Dreissena polymorpha]|uniref:Uncharacterized protein n=1 Tax=Dreissena polymorpha TaxID=45954 RepID=A0A9D3YYG9_DREPO|nr:hypothetical protein DPMN_067756 [Dreissena polymorpha]